MAVNSLLFAPPHTREVAVLPAKEVNGEAFWTKEGLPNLDLYERPKQISCSNCVSACCRAGNTLPLYPHEIVALNDTGTPTEEIVPPVYRRSLLTGKERIVNPGVYKLLSNCGNLAINQETGETYCAAYDGERFKVCMAVEVGGTACRKFREEYEVAPPGSFAAYEYVDREMS